MLELGEKTGDLLVMKAVGVARATDDGVVRERLREEGVDRLREVSIDAAGEEGVFARVCRRKSLQSIL